MKIQKHVKTEYLVYPYFYEEFYKNFLMREKGLKHLILAGVFLHLTFENIVTYYIRFFVNYVIDGYKGESKQQFWDKVFEEEMLPKKLDFFYFVILHAPNENSENIIQDIKIFYDRSASLRNKIVHGHEIWEKKFHNGKTEKSKLDRRLEKKELEKIYNDFWINLNNFLNLFVLANSMQPNATRWKEEFIKEDLIDKPIRTLKEIEKNLINCNKSKKGQRTRTPN
jgi:hypothetical protein